MREQGDRTMKSGEIREQIRARHKELERLEARAGIGAPAEQLRRASPLFKHARFARETDPDRRQELWIDFERRLHEEKTNRGMRELYFSVRDTDLRRALIEKEREIGHLSLRFWQEELNEAAARLRDTETTGRYWWVSPSILGIFFIGGNYYLFGLYGAVLVGPILLVFFWILLAQESHRQALPRREAAIEKANRKFKDAEKNWNIAKDQPQLFSPVEAMTGEPDRGPLQALAHHYSQKS
jgi:hypothetical protein